MQAKTIEELEAAAAVAAAESRAAWEAYQEACKAHVPGTPNVDYTPVRTAARKATAAHAAVTRAKHAADPTYRRREKTLRVVTEYGTFERTTPRAYTHVIIVRRTEAQMRKDLTDDVAGAEERLSYYESKLPLCNAAGCYVETRTYSRPDGTQTSYSSTHEYGANAERTRKDLAASRAQLAALEGPGPWSAYRWSQSLKNVMGGVREVQKWGGREYHVIEVATGKAVA